MGVRLLARTLKRRRFLMSKHYIDENEDRVSFREVATGVFVVFSFVSLIVVAYGLFFA